MMLCQWFDAPNTIVHLVDQYGNDRNVPIDYPGDFRLSNGVADVLALLGKSGPDAYVAPPAPDLAAIDQAALNAALTAPGSVTRALALVMFAEVNKLRVKNGDAAYTMAQFTASLKAQMR